MFATIVRRRRFAVNAADWLPSQVVPHQATRCGSPRHTLQVWRKERPIRETVLIKGTDQVLPCLLLFFRVSFINPRLQERHEFRVTILGRQGLVQQLYGVRVENESLALGLLGQALFQVWW
jgi:hypothetical protein